MNRALWAAIGLLGGLVVGLPGGYEVAKQQIEDGRVASVVAKNEDQDQRLTLLDTQLQEYRFRLERYEDELQERSEFESGGEIEDCEEKMRSAFDIYIRENADFQVVSDLQKDGLYHGRVYKVIYQYEEDRQPIGRFQENVEHIACLTFENVEGLNYIPVPKDLLASFLELNE